MLEFNNWQNNHVELAYMQTRESQKLTYTQVKERLRTLLMIGGLFALRDVFQNPYIKIWHFVT